MHDFRWAVRWLRRNPLFAVAVVAILGLGIGASTAAFSITDAVLLRPATDSARRSLVRVEEKSTKRSIFGMPAKDYLRWRDRSDVFQTSAPFVKDMVTLGGIDRPDQMFALRTEGRLFTMLGARAAIGRALLDTDDAAGDVVVIADRLWERCSIATRALWGGMSLLQTSLTPSPRDAAGIRVSHGGSGDVDGGAADARADAGGVGGGSAARSAVGGGAERDADCGAST